MFGEAMETVDGNTTGSLKIKIIVKHRFIKSEVTGKAKSDDGKVRSEV